MPSKSSVSFWLTVLFVLFPPPVVSVVPKGNAAFVYDASEGPVAMWAAQILNFNQNVTNQSHAISTIITYGGDMEYYAGPNPYYTYFSTENQAAAQEYAKVAGVDNVVCIIDGNMNGTHKWAPNLANLTKEQVQEWAHVTSKTYCAFDYVGGVLISLMPMAPPFIVNVQVYVEQLCADFASTTYGCVDAAHPQGRHVGVLVPGSQVGALWAERMGDNGYVIVVGYDLSEFPIGDPSTPSYFDGELDYRIELITNAIIDGSLNNFLVAIPAAASYHEFSQLTMANGTVVQGYPMYSSDSTDNYVATGVSTLKNSFYYRATPGYLGAALWSFSPSLAYPAQSKNYFYPSNPFQVAGEFQYLANNL